MNAARNAKQEERLSGSAFFLFVATTISVELRGRGAAGRSGGLSSPPPRAPGVCTARPRQAASKRSRRVVLAREATSTRERMERVEVGAPASEPCETRASSGAPWGRSRPVESHIGLERVGNAERAEESGLAAETMPPVRGRTGRHDCSAPRRTERSQRDSNSHRRARARRACRHSSKQPQCTSIGGASQRPMRERCVPDARAPELAEPGSNAGEARRSSRPRAPRDPPSGGERGTQRPRVRRGIDTVTSLRPASACKGAAHSARSDPRSLREDASPPQAVELRRATRSAACNDSRSLIARG